MKALVTGARGTVGSALCARLAQHGHEVIAWDRERVPVDDYHAMEAFVRASAPDVLFHLAIAARPTGRDNESWLVNYEWPSELAWITRILDIDFVFTSTAMVFSDRALGPFTRASVPDAPHGYGYEKRRAEDRVFAQNPRARVVRLGWQIGDAPGSNTMIDHLERTMQEHGEVRASTRWLPATSFLVDTAEALAVLPASPPGLYMLDSNTGWSFFDIARALSGLHGQRWTITATDDFVYDQRLVDGGVSMPSLAQRLPLEHPPRSASS
jgi:dTDP-4-dehydrorhamnose reductase